jgi:hypothetical protein
MNNRAVNRSDNSHYCQGAYPKYYCCIVGFYYLWRDSSIQIREFLDRISSFLDNDELFADCANKQFCFTTKSNFILK